MNPEFEGLQATLDRLEEEKKRRQSAQLYGGVDSRLVPLLNQIQSLPSNYQTTTSLPTASAVSPQPTSTFNYSDLYNAYRSAEPEQQLAAQAQPQTLQQLARPESLYAQYAGAMPAAAPPAPQESPAQTTVGSGATPALNSPALGTNTPNFAQDATLESPASRAEGAMNSGTTDPQDIFKRYQDVNDIVGLQPPSAAPGGPDQQPPPYELGSGPVAVGGPAVTPDWQKRAEQNDAYRAAMTAEITPEMLAARGLNPAEVEEFYRRGDAYGNAQVFKTLRGFRDELQTPDFDRYKTRVITDKSPEQLQADYRASVDRRNKYINIYNDIYDQAEQNFRQSNPGYDTDSYQFNPTQWQYGAQSPDVGNLSPEDQYKATRDYQLGAIKDYDTTFNRELNNLQLTPELLARYGVGAQKIKDYMSKSPGMTFADRNQIDASYSPIGYWSPGQVNPWQRIQDDFRSAYQQVNKRPDVVYNPDYETPIQIDPGHSLGYEIGMPVLTSGLVQTPQDLYQAYSSVLNRAV